MKLLCLPELNNKYNRFNWQLNWMYLAINLIKLVVIPEVNIISLFAKKVNGIVFKFFNFWIFYFFCKYNLSHSCAHILKFLIKKEKFVWEFCKKTRLSPKSLDKDIPKLFKLKHYESYGIFSFLQKIHPWEIL